MGTVSGSFCVHMNNNTTIPVVDCNSKSQIVFVSFVALCLFSTIALAEHIAVMFIIFSNKTLRSKPVAMSILLLSSSDILLSLAYFVMSLIGLVPMRHTWICALTYYLIQVGCVTSLTSTLTICIERYLCSKPTPTKPFSLPQRLKAIFISLGICSFIFGIPYIFTIKTPKMQVCGILPLFQENLPYAIAPVRSIMFLVWISTVVVYAITTKNFQNYKKMEQNVKSRQLTTHNDIPKPTKTGHIDNTDIQTVSQRCSVTVRYTSSQNNEATDIGPIENVSSKQHVHRPMTNDKSSGGAGSTKLKSHTQMNSHSQLKAVKVFRIISVVFVVFLLSMTGQCVIGLVMVFSPMPIAVEAVCGVLSTTTVLTNPIMYMFLLKDYIFNFRFNDNYN